MPYQLIGITGSNEVKLVEEKDGENETVASFAIQENTYGIVSCCKVEFMGMIKVPMFCVTVVYDFKVKQVVLMNLFLYFNVKEKIYSIELEEKIHDKRIVIDENYGVFPGFKKMVSELERIVRMDVIVGLIGSLIESEKENIRSEMRDMYDFSFKIPEPTINIRDYLK